MEQYTEKDVNRYGDVEVVRKGWVTCSLMMSRGAPMRYRILVGWKGSRRFLRPIKNAVVPAEWLEQKLKKKSKPRPSLADRLAGLPEAVRGACVSRNSHDCGRCMGYGMEWSERYEREVKCRRCHGEGREHTDAICGASITAAARIIAAGGSMDDARLAAIKRNPSPDREEWDGTLTSTWERGGFIDSDEAAKIREKTAHRHENTNYDDLLSRGFSRDEAREMME